MKHEEFLKQVKERAEAATPGWTSPVPGFIRTKNGNGYGFSLGENDAEYCAAANPQAVLKLLAIIEKLKVAMVDIANKNTCWRLYEIDKYKSYEDGWEGVAEFATNTLKELDEIVGLG